MKKTKTTAAPVATIADIADIVTNAKIGTTIKGTDYMVYYGTARACRLEDEFDLPFGRIIEKVGDADIRAIRACIRIGLEHHHFGPNDLGSAIAATVDHVIEQAGAVACSAAIVAEVNMMAMGVAARAALAKKAA